MTFFDPIEALQTAFGSVFNSITQAIANIPALVIQGVTNAVTSSLSFVVSTLQSLPGQIYNQLIYLKDQILGGLAGIPGQVASLFGGIDKILTNALNSFGSQITAQFTNAYTQLRNFITPSLNSLQTAFSSGLTSVQNALSGLPGFISKMILDTQTQLSKLGADLNSNIRADLTQVANIGATITTGLNNLSAQFTALGSGIGQAFNSLANIGQQFFVQITQGAQALYNATLRPIIDGFSTQVSALAQTIANLPKAIQSINPAQAVALASGVTAAIAAVMAARWAVDSAIKAATFGQVSVLERQVTELLEALGIIGLSARFALAPIDYGILPLVKRGWQSIAQPEIPGVGEVLEMADRGALDGTGLIRAPAATLQVINEHGLSATWADRLWTIHFSPLGLAQIADAFHRKIMDSAEFQRRLELLKIYPQDKAILQQLIFTFPGIRQLRSLVKLNLLSDSQIQDAVDATGLRPDYREPFITSLNEANIIPLYDRMDAAAMGGYEDFLINDADLASLLTLTGKKKNIIDAEIKIARFKRDLNFRKAQIAVITTLLKKGILTPDEALAKFLSLGLDSERAGLITSLAQYELDAATSKKVKKVAPDLSVAQIQKAMKTGLLTADDGFATFTARGYDSNEARTLVELAYGASTTPALSKDEILTGLKKKVLAMPEAVAKLLQIGFSPDDTKILIASTLAATI